MSLQRVATKTDELQRQRLLKNVEVAQVISNTQPAIRAGYGEKTAGRTGDENLKKPEIAQAISEAQAKRSGLDTARKLRAAGMPPVKKC